MRFPRLAVLLLTLACVSQRASAVEFVGVDLPELVGPAPAYGDGVSVELDFGREFAAVHRVLLLLRASTTPLVVERCGYLHAPEPCTDGVINVGFLATLSGPLDYSYAAVGDFRSFAVERVGVFKPFFGTDFEHLTDGQGTLRLGWNSVFYIPEELVTELEPPTGVIEEALLIAEVTPLGDPMLVPEPDPVLAQLTGLASAIALACARRRRSRLDAG